MLRKFTNPEYVDVAADHQWQTNKSREAKYLRGNNFAVMTPLGNWIIIEVNKHGYSECYEISIFDLPKKGSPEVWVNIHENGQLMFDSRTDADRSTLMRWEDFGKRIARIRVPFIWEEGQFDE